MSPLRYDDDSRFTAPSAGLYSFATARKSDPQTAKDAAKSMTAPILSNQRLVVLRLVRAMPYGGATAYDVSCIANLQQNVTARRLKDLADMGLVERTNETRPGHSHRACAVYRITDAGREALR